MSPARSRSFVPWLLIAVIALIAYGSLYPFNLKPDTLGRTVLDALSELSWARAGRGDRIANVLLYLPLGFCLFLWLSSLLRRSLAIIVTVALGSVLSLAVEVGQVYISSRVPSLTDLTLNALGTLIGATAGTLWDKMGGLMHLPRRVEKPPHRDPSAALLIVFWLLWRLAPFLPHFDLGKLKAALQPLFRPQIDLSGTLIWLTYWVVISQALSALVSRAQTLEALLIMIAAVLVGRLIVADQAFVPAELVALIALLPIVVLMYRMTPGPKRLLVLSAMLGAFLFERLAPFTFVGPPQAFDFWPFLAWFAAGFSTAVTSIDWVGFFGTIFLFAAMLWVLRYVGISFRLAASIVLALVCATELLQLWLPERSASITDPVIALGVVLGFRYTQRKQRRMFTGRPVSRRGHTL